jgi:hypothetical protein
VYDVSRFSEGPETCALDECDREPEIEVGSDVVGAAPNTSWGGILICKECASDVAGDLRSMGVEDVTQYVAVEVT